MPQFHKLEIQEIIKQTPNAVSITFNVPDKLKGDFLFQAGQYITIKKEIDGEDIRRAYSICSAPSSGELTVAVKSVEDGTFSVFANTQLQEGDTLEVSAPEGRFVLSPNAEEQYIAFAAGSGITPVMSMLKTALAHGSSFTLIYGNKTVAETIFKTELDALSEQYASFNLHYIYSQEQVDDTLFGRCDVANANYFLRNVYANQSFDKAFLCGPESMIKTVTEVLSENGLSDTQIYYELFSAPIEDEASKIDIPEGNSEVTVLLDDEETTFIMPQKKTLLEVALKKDLDAPYSCQGGICSSCLARITEGKATMARNEILTDDEIAEGLILTCQAHPTTPRIKIDYDDV